MHLLILFQTNLRRSFCFYLSLATIEVVTIIREESVSCDRNEETGSKTILGIVSRLVSLKLFSERPVSRLILARSDEASSEVALVSQASRINSP